MKISVAMCTYNGERYVEEQIDSIIAQTVRPFELIVRDDRSSDATTAIVERIARTAPFPIRMEVNASRLGSTKNFEGAIAACSGDVIALADQDDVWLPEKLAVLAAALTADPGLNAVFSDAELVDKVLHPLGSGMFDYLDLRADHKDRVRRDDAFDLVLRWSFVTGATLAFRSGLKPYILPIPTGSPLMLHDKWIAIVAVAVGKLGIVDRKLVKYRQHAQQQIGTSAAVPAIAARFTEMNVRDFRTEADYLTYLLQLKTYLDANASGATRPNFARILGGKIRHLEARLRLSPNPLRRMVQVSAEFLSGRYRDHSGGARSAAKDVLRR